VYAEEALLGWISMRLGKPQSGSKRGRKYSVYDSRRGQVGYVEIDAKTTARLRVCAITFSRTSAPIINCYTRIPTLTGLMLSGAYKIPAIQINVTACFTNKMPRTLIVARRPKQPTSLNVRWIWLPRNWDGCYDVRRKTSRQPMSPFHTATVWTMKRQLRSGT